MNQQSETVGEVVEEVTTISTENPETQTVGVEGSATAQDEQSLAEREAVISSSKENRMSPPSPMLAEPAGATTTSGFSRAIAATTVSLSTESLVRYTLGSSGWAR